MDIKYTKDGVIIGGVFIALEEIIEKVNEVKIGEGNLTLLTMSWKGGRGFDGVIEQIVLPIDIIENLVELMVGKQIYFGEIAGKHSEVYGTFDEDDYEISTDKKEIGTFLDNHPSGRTYNHSFINTFYDQGMDGEYDDIDETVLEKLFKEI
jgi:hypothetical protein